MTILSAVMRCVDSHNIMTPRDNTSGLYMPWITLQRTLNMETPMVPLILEWHVALCPLTICQEPSILWTLLIFSIPQSYTII